MSCIVYVKNERKRSQDQGKTPLFSSHLFSSLRSLTYVQPVRHSTAPLRTEPADIQHACQASRRRMMDGWVDGKEEKRMIKTKNKNLIYNVCCLALLCPALLCFAPMMTDVLPALSPRNAHICMYCCSHCVCTCLPCYGMCWL
jgi:hypothetical protein